MTIHRNQRCFQPAYREGWAYDADARAELNSIKAWLADPLVASRSSYCRELARLSITDVIGDIGTTLDTVVEIKVARKLAEIERRTA